LAGAARTGAQVGPAGDEAQAPRLRGTDEACEDSFRDPSIQVRERLVVRRHNFSQAMPSFSHRATGGGRGAVSYLPIHVHDEQRRIDSERYEHRHIDPAGLHQLLLDASYDAKQRRRIERSAPYRGSILSVR
jgi:hypothetical protein